MWNTFEDFWILAENRLNARSGYNDYPPTQEEIYELAECEYNNYLKSMREIEDEN